MARGPGAGDATEKSVADTGPRRLIRSGFRMQKHIRWLLAEIDRWVADGLVTPEQAGKLRARYTPAEAGPPWGLIVFAAAGAIVIGLGVILLFAYNWAAIPKFGKLGLVFCAIIAAHAGSIRMLAGDGWRPKMGEALAALATMLYGAGIWLVAQIYNIDEHFPNGFLFWALGALAMAWAIRSTVNGLMAVVLIVIWGSFEIFEFSSPRFGSVLLIAATLVPLAWKQRSPLLLAASVLAIQFLVVANAGSWGGVGHAFVSSLGLAVLLVAAGRLARSTFEQCERVLVFLGTAQFLVFGFILSFEEAADDLLKLTGNEDPGLAPCFTWTLVIVALAAWAWIAERSMLRRRMDVDREEWLLPLMLLVCTVFALLGSRDWALLIAWSFNLVLLGTAAMWMWRGCRESRLAPTVLGSLLLSAIVLARYFDLFHSLASRGLAFIILGGVFIGEALYYRRVKRETGGGS